MEAQEYISASTSATESPATLELRAILSNPDHKLHGPLMRNDPEANAYIDSLYKRDYPNPGAPPAKTEPNGTIPAPVMPLITREDRVDQAAYEEMLRGHFGDGHDAIMADVAGGVNLLCTTPEAVKVLDAFCEVIATLGSNAELLSLRYLSDLGQVARMR